MSEFSMESVRMFMIQKGGLCTNHDLVANFKPYLNHPSRKLENRNKLKEFVQLLALVETRNGEKVLVLKKRYNEQGCFNLLSNQEQSSEHHRPQEAPELQVRQSNSQLSRSHVSSNASLPPQEKISYQDVTSKAASAAGDPLDFDFYSMLADHKNAITEQNRSANLQECDVPDARTLPYAGGNVELSAVKENVEAVPTDNCCLERDTDVNKTPITAKDRIKQFDLISSDQQSSSDQHRSEVPSDIPSEPLTLSQLYPSKKANSQDPLLSQDYDGSIMPLSLDAKEKEWMMISSACNYQAMSKLLNAQPEFAHRRHFINGYNAMHWAAKLGRPEIIKMLNGYMVDATLRSYSGYTPLHLAAMAGNEECIDLLVNLCQVSPNTRDFYGRRPKQYLKKNCSTRIQQMLLNNSRHSFAVGNTVGDNNAFTRTQSFSAKIMKTTQGLARKLTHATRASHSSDSVSDMPDTVGPVACDSDGAMERADSVSRLHPYQAEETFEYIGMTATDMPMQSFDCAHDGASESSIAPSASTGSAQGFSNIQ